MDEILNMTKGSSSSKSFLWRDIDDLRNIKRELSAPGQHDVLDLLSGPARKKTAFQGVLNSTNRLDEYNALALRIQSSMHSNSTDSLINPDVLSRLGEAIPRLTDKERSAWYASSHLSKAYHQIADEIRTVPINLSSIGMEGIPKKITRIIGTNIGLVFCNRSTFANGTYFMT